MVRVPPRSRWLRKNGGLEDSAARAERIRGEGQGGSREPQGCLAQRTLRLPPPGDSRVEGGPDVRDVPRHEQQHLLRSPVDRVGRRHRRRVDRVHEHRHGRQQDAHARVQRAHSAHGHHAPSPRDQPHVPLFPGDGVSRRRHLPEPGRHRLEAHGRLLDRGARGYRVQADPHRTLRQVHAAVAGALPPRLPHDRAVGAHEHRGHRVQDSRRDDPEGGDARRPRARPQTRGDAVRVRRDVGAGRRDAGGQDGGLPRAVQQVVGGGVEERLVPRGGVGFRLLRRPGVDADATVGGEGGGLRLQPVRGFRQHIRAVRGVHQALLLPQQLHQEQALLHVRRQRGYGQDGADARDSARAGLGELVLQHDQHEQLHGRARASGDHGAAAREEVGSSLRTARRQANGLLLRRSQHALRGQVRHPDANRVGASEHRLQGLVRQAEDRAQGGAQLPVHGVHEPHRRFFQHHAAHAETLRHLCGADAEQGGDQHHVRADHRRAPQELRSGHLQVRPEGCRRLHRAPQPRRQHLPAVGGQVSLPVEPPRVVQHHPGHLPHASRVLHQPGGPRAAVDPRVRARVQRSHDAHQRHREVRHHARQRDQEVLRGSGHGCDRGSPHLLQRVHTARLAGQRRVLPGGHVREAEQDSGGQAQRAQREQRGDGPRALQPGHGPRDSNHSHLRSPARQRHVGRRRRLRQAIARPTRHVHLRLRGFPDFCHVFLRHGRLQG
mmetsp:Transcript_13461/g.52800  ORF Transcript_13461/g.52800 Transcript_13461/m.52800 type:complete len:720 (+) Transcript_13461:6716-8875(+)